MLFVASLIILYTYMLCLIAGWFWAYGSCTIDKYIWK